MAENEKIEADPKEKNPEIQTPTPTEQDFAKEGGKVVSRMMGAMISSKNYPPFLDKIEGEQISEMIKTYGDSEKREYRDYELRRRYVLTFVILALLLIVFFTYTLANTNSNLYEEILKLLLAFGIGMVGGYGFGRSRND